MGHALSGRSARRSGSMGLLAASCLDGHLRREDAGPGEGSRQGTASVNVSNVKTYDTDQSFFQIGELTIPSDGEDEEIIKMPATKIALFCSGSPAIHVVIYGRP